MSAPNRPVRRAGLPERPRSLLHFLYDDGSIAVYGHMETLDVTVGKRVTAGQRIAGMGNRGFSTGSHLHLERYPTGSGAVDPLPWFAEHGVTF